jgi:Ni/Fe-hydrogenase subunit HybB-like protein
MATKPFTLANSMRYLPKITLWRTLVIAIFAVGLYAAWVRFFEGFAASTNLTNTVPWGLWVGLNTLCGVGLSASGFAIAAAVYILGFERYRPVLRAAILMAFLGYSTVVVGMLFELGLPWRIWHPILYWNRASVLFEVAWCVMLYTTVLALEFSPQLFEKLLLRWPRLRGWYLGWHHRILIGLVLVGVLLSSLHQSYLGGLYLIMKDKLYPLWYSPQMHNLFFLSAIPAGVALLIMVMYLSVRSLGARVEYRVVEELSRLMLLLLSFYGLFRAVDLVVRGQVHYLWQPRAEVGMFWLEIALFLMLPILLLMSPEVRANPVKLYWTSALVVMGFISNRINVAVTALDASSGVTYVPKWSEFALSLLTITAAVVAFRYAVLYLDVFPRAAGEPRAAVRMTPHSSPYVS